MDDIRPEDKDQLRKLSRDLYTKVNELLATDGSPFEKLQKDVGEMGYQADFLFAMFTRFMVKPDEEPKKPKTDTEFLRENQLRWFTE